MAQTTSRVVELQIKLQGAQSIAELEQVTSEINQELKGISTSSKSFTQMGNLAKQANSRVKEVGQSLEGITSTEKSEAINKMGQGLVGAFQSAAGASLLFGEKSSEALQKTIAKVGGLFAVTDGLKKVTEAFSAKNISALKATVKGWQESAVAAKLFGSTTRAAITSTGIGALIVLFGLIVANFDKIKAAVQKNMESIKKFLMFFAPPLYLVITLVEKIKEKFGDLQNFIAGVGAVIKKVLQFDFTDLGKTFDETIAKEKELDVYAEEYNTLLKETKQLLDDELEIMDAQGVTMDKKIAKQKEYNDKLIKNLQAQKALGRDIGTEGEKQLADALQQNKVLDARLITYKKETAEKAKQTELEKLKKKIEEEKAKTELIINNKQKSINIDIADINQNIKKILESETEELLAQAETTGLITDVLQEQYDKIEKTNELINDSLQNDKLKLNNAQEYFNKLVETAEFAADANNPEAVKALGEYLHKITMEWKQQNELIERTQKYIDGFTAGNTENMGIILNLNDEEKKKLIVLQGQKELLIKTNELKKEELILQGKNNSTAIQTNVEEIANLKLKGEKLLKIKDEIVSEYNKNFLIDKSKLTEIELLILKGRELDLTNEIQDINADIQDNNADSNNLLNENIVLKKEQVKLNTEIVNLGDNVLDIERQQGEIIGENTEVYLNKWQKAIKTIQGFLKGHKKEIIAAIELANEALQQTMELLATLDERKAEMAQRELDKYIEDNEEKVQLEADAQQQIADDKKKAQEDAASNEEELMQMLADAEGERYNDLRLQIKQVQDDKAAAALAETAALAEKDKIEKAYKNEVLKREYAVQEAEWKAAKHRKTAAIIQATVDTTLAVIKALPNVFLAAAAGVLGAVGIGIIAAQPLPPKPELKQLKSGGYTGDGSVDTVAGIVHAGEYVVPQRVMKNPEAQGMVSALEGMRLKGYAGGGVVTPNTGAVQNTFDYQRIGDEVGRALRANPMFVSWTEWRDINSQMQFVGNRAALGKK